MSGDSKKVLVLSGDGINCELETAAAFKTAGFEPRIVHLNDLIAERMSLDTLSSTYSAIALPGGFSFGDDVSSGRVLALKIRHGLRWDLGEYAARGGLVLGICNGFQALIRLGVFGKGVAITHNSQGKFINQWTKVTPRGGKCVWLKGVGTIDIPIRHGEGKLVLEADGGIKTIDRLDRDGMSCLRYEQNPNGSEADLAGLCDSTGRIFGLMPHPEAFVRWTAHPDWTADPERAGGPGQGLALFENALIEAKASS
jgi:phosphoribosylformylglycinamidine (FGAM) synthase-like amidotransferase family enzyme